MDRAARGGAREWLANEPLTFVLAAESEQSYLGYAFVRVRPATFATSWSASDPLAELSILAVLPKARGRGIGSALLNAVEARLREMGVQDMTISVVTTNVDAMRLYERRGASPVRHRAGAACLHDEPGRAEKHIQIELLFQL